MLYAGPTSLYTSIYSIQCDIVKKVEGRSKSAGNILNIKNGTSETLRDEIIVYSEHVKSISIHVPKHLKLLNYEQLGHYLAGFIDGNGHFSKAQQLILVFSSSDVFLAYYLKKELVYGNVRKVKDKNKNAYHFIFSNKQDILKVINLINGKLRTEHRFHQLINNILNDDKYKDTNIHFTLNSSNDFNNHWLAGFTDADGSFQIKISRPLTKRKPEVRLNYQIDQKNDQLLKRIKDYLGGIIGYRESQDTYYYGSTYFGSAKNVIHYFDRYNLQSKKHVSYLRWRKVYILIQNKEHLTEKGLTKIMKIKALLNPHE